MNNPLVTIVCISYNHALYVRQALESVCLQTYKNIELIIADDASTDESIKEIKRFIQGYPALTYTTLFNEKREGNCVLFNKALRLSRGKYVIDLAADDYLYPTCIERQVNIFESLTKDYGVVFSNVDLVNEQGEHYAHHYPVDEQGKSKVLVPEGDVYQEILKRYFISPVGMMIKKDVLIHLGGYDETLAYEDFDFWVRSSRYYKYKYIDELLVAKRKTPGSLSSKFTHQGNSLMFESTARVCEKAAWLNQSKEENKALRVRIHYEIKQAIRYKATSAFEQYLVLMKNLRVSRVVRLFYVAVEKIRTAF